MQNPQIANVKSKLLQRLQASSPGRVAPEMPNCPLVPNGAVAKVSSTGKGFAVAIRSDDPAVARGILVRAERVVATSESKARRQP